MPKGNDSHYEHPNMMYPQSAATTNWISLEGGFIVLKELENIVFGQSGRHVLLECIYHK